MADWKPSPRVQAFLAAIRLVPSITVAAKSAGICRRAHYSLLESSPDYKAAYVLAYECGVQALEDEAVRRAQFGVRKPVMYHGKPVVVKLHPEKRASKRNPKVPLYEVEYSDTLMLALLKAKRPDQYRERVQQELTGKDGGPIDNRLEIVFVKAPDKPPEDES